MTSGEKNGERKSLNVTQILLDFRDDKLQVGYEAVKRESYLTINPLNVAESVPTKNALDTATNLKMLYKICLTFKL